jgi:L-aspartate oxidase
LPKNRLGHFVQPRRITGSRAAEPAARREAYERLRLVMSKHVGVVRSARGLRSALAMLKTLDTETPNDMVLSNMILAARLVASAALLRKESRGGHYRADYPVANPALQHRTFLTLDDLAVLDKKPHSHRAPPTHAGCET